MNDDTLKNDLNTELEGGELEESAEELESENATRVVSENEGSENGEDGANGAESDTDDVVFDDESELGTAEVIKKLRAKLKVAVEEKQTYLNGWQRDKAEFVNARKRDEESKSEFLKFAKQGVIEEILPVLDSFDMAMGSNGGAQATAWESVSKEWQTGVLGIYNQLVGVLAKQGVTAFGAKGDTFDPNLHHSIGIGMIKTEVVNDEHKVAEVAQKGYMMNGKVVRPALVRVWEV